MAFAQTDVSQEIGASYRYPAPEVMQLDIVMQPYRFLKMVSAVQIGQYEKYGQYDADVKKKQDAVVIIDDGEPMPVQIKPFGASSLELGLSYPSRRIPIKLLFERDSAGIATFQNESIKLLNVPTPASFFVTWIAMQAYAFMGIPTPDMKPVFIRFNREDFGLYLSVEEINKTFLHRHFDSIGSLYKNDAGGVHYPLFGFLKTEVDSGNDTLSNFVYALENDLSIEPYIDVDEFLRFMACEAFTNEQDGLLISTYNYYLYDNGGKLVLLPWDNDTTFAVFPEDQSEREVSIMDFENAWLAQILLKNPKNKEKYYEYIERLNNEFANPDTFLPQLEQAIRRYEPYFRRDPTILKQSDSVREDLTTGNNLYYGGLGNLLLTFSLIHDQLNAQLHGRMDVYTVPENCTVATATDEMMDRYIKSGHQERMIRICTNYWALRRQAFWQMYGTQTVIIGSFFVLFTGIAVLSVCVPKGGFRRRKKREDVRNE